MAGDWIKIRTDLHEDPAVGTIATALSIDKWGVVGRLLRIWSWADAQSRSGHADVTALFLDDLVNTSGMADAMVLVRWLEIPENGHIVFPKFDRHNGKPAKERALTTRRKQDQRSREGHADVTPSSRKPRDQRREEKSNTPQPPASTSGGESSRAGPRPDEAGPRAPRQRRNPQEGLTSTAPSHSPWGTHLADQTEIRAKADTRLQNTQEAIAEGREAAQNASPMPEHLRKFIRIPKDEPFADDEPEAAAGGAT